MSAANAAEKQRQRGRPFPKGTSGNPAGKRPGTRNRATLAAEVLLDGEAETLTRKAIELAKQGDMAALRVCLDRILPPRRERPIQFRLPPMRCAGDAAAAMAALTDAVADGQLTASEAAELSRLIESYLTALEVIDFDQRLRTLEQRGTQES
jgi:hypothetical protein